MSASYKIEVRYERREDGGLRAWSPDVPELVLSHADADKVFADVPRALEVILAERLGAPMRVEELVRLPAPANADDQVDEPDRREFAARAAA